jgi:hypothetical protein
LLQGDYAIPSRSSIKALAKKIRPLLIRVAAGHTTHWNGNNMVGRLTDDAKEASDEIEEIVSGNFRGEGWDWTEDTQVWDASEWLAACGYLTAAKDYGLRLDSTKEEIAAIEKRMESAARGDYVVLTDIDSAIDRMKEALQEEADEADED